MNGEVYTTSPGPVVPPSPYQFAVNRKDEEIRKLKIELQSLALNVSDLESEVKQRDYQLAKKDKLIAQLKQGRTLLKNAYEQDVENLKPFQEKCIVQDGEIKRLQLNSREIDLQRKAIENLENEKDVLVNEKQALLEKIIGLKDQTIENNCLSNFIEEQKVKIDELQSLINCKNEDIEEFCKMKELYEQQIQQLHAQCAENLEFIEQQRINQSDMAGEVLSVVCVEKQVEELKAELGELREFHLLEKQRMQLEKEEEVNKLEILLDQSELRRKSDLEMLDRVVEMYEQTSKDVFEDVRRSNCAFSELEVLFSTAEETVLQKFGNDGLEMKVKNENIELQRNEIVKLKRDFETTLAAKAEVETLNEELRIDREVAKTLFLEFESEKQLEIEKYKEEKEKLEKYLKNTIEFADGVSRRAELCREESEDLREVVAHHMEFAEDKLRLIEMDMEKWLEKEISYREIIEKLEKQSKEETSRCGNLQNRIENVELELREFGNAKNEEINRLVFENESLLREINDVLSENGRLKSLLVTKEKFLDEIASRLEAIELERGDLVEIFEGTAQELKESTGKLITETNKLEDIVVEGDLRISKLENEIFESNNVKIEEINALLTEKECLSNEFNECKLKLARSEQENEELVVCLAEYDDKIASLVLDANKLRSENHELGLSHELAMSEKLEIYRGLWETEKNSRELEKEENEKLKIQFSERLKQEEMKCNLLRQNLMKLMEDSEEKSKSTAIISELREKVELYKHHYEDQKEKISSCKDQLQEEMKNMIFAKAKITALEKKNSSLENELADVKRHRQMFCSPILSNKTRTVFSKCAPDLHSTEIDSGRVLSYDLKQFRSTEDLDDSLDSFKSEMSSFQSGDHKMDGNKRMQKLKFFMGADDEEEDDWDLKYVKQLKAGNCNVPDTGGRLTELQRRNTLCLPHLKTTYPVETQMCGAIPFEEDEFKRGKAILEEFKVPKPKNSSPKDNRLVSEELNDTRRRFYSHTSPKRKVKATEPVYRKPGPPTPAKNMALILQKTPSSLKRLFGSKRVFKPNPRKPVAFNVGFSPLKAKSRRRLVSSPKDESPKPSGFRNKLKIFNKAFKQKMDESVVLSQF